MLFESDLGHFFQYISVQRPCHGVDQYSVIISLASFANFLIPTAILIPQIYCSCRIPKGSVLDLCDDPVEELFRPPTRK